jgi:uncharacterized protein with HEPN domain
MSRDPLRVLDYLDHILEAIRRIQQYCEGIDQTAFLKNQLVQDAVIRNFEINGEASRNIERVDPQFLISHPELPLSFAYDMRNGLAHGYRLISNPRNRQVKRGDKPYVWRHYFFLFLA